MMTDKDKWQHKPDEGEHAARRDGERKEEGFNPWKRNNEGQSGKGGFDRPRRVNTDGNSFDRPRRSFNSGFGTDRPNRSYNDGSERSGRSYGDNANRPNRSYGDNSGRPNRSYGDNTDRPSRSYGDRGNRFEGNSGEGNSFERPRRSFNSNDQARPRRPFNNAGFDKPRRSFGDEASGRSQRRSFNDEGSGGFDKPRRSSVDGNRFGESNYRSDDSGNRFGGSEYKPRRSFGEYAPKPRFSGPTLPKPDRADGRPRRPRIRKESGFDHGVPYGRPTGYQPTLDPTIPIRLNKFLANAGICSRREADEFIQAGVVKVNGDVVSELGVKVLPTDTILFHDQPVNIERKVYILLNKPKDCVTTSDDPQERLTVMDLVKGACYERIYPVGRLDRNTTGVLLLTNDGDLASKLTHPKFEKRKIYQVTLDKNLAENDYRAISEGVTLDDELIAVDNLSYVDPDKLNVIGIEIHSGQNRVVRRIFEQFGYKVFKLDRVYFAGLTKKNLPRGKWRHLTEKEVNLLKMGAFV